MPKANHEPAQYATFKHEDWQLTFLGGKKSLEEKEQPMKHEEEREREADEAHKQAIQGLEMLFARWESSDHTGEIFNAHMAFADWEGLDSPNCIKLAEAFKAAVKASKHGTTYSPDFPQPEFFPHYMYVKPSKKSTGYRHPRLQ